MIEAPFPLTMELAGVLAELSAPSATGPDLRVPELAASRVQVAFLETTGLIAAGLHEPAATVLGRAMASAGETSGATAEALLLGTAAHALDFDDVAFGGHVSAVLAPAILAAARATGASGAAMQRAYIAGYETWSELATRERTLYHVRGFHPTSAFGAVAAAGACAVLLGLDAPRIGIALSLGASQAAGLAANFGSMAKCYHAGQAARAGVMAALLAQCGYSANPDALEAPKGFLRAFSPAGEIDLARPLNYTSNGHWMLEQRPPNIKRYPVCYAAHRTVDAALALHQQVKPEEIARIHVTISRRHGETLRHTNPATVSEARFSLEFALATALARGQLGMRELSSETLADPLMRNLMTRVERHYSDEPDAALDGFAAFDQVIIHDHAGKVYASPQVRRALGHADNPIGPAEVKAKFTDCMAMAGRAEHSADVFHLLSNLDTQDNPSRVLFDALPNLPLNGPAH